MPSSSCVTTPSSWFEAALPVRSKGELCAATMVILLYLRAQNSGQLLQGRVLVTAGCVAVEDAVPVPLTGRVTVVVWEPVMSVTVSSGDAAVDDESVELDAIDVPEPDGVEAKVILEGKDW